MPQGRTEIPRPLERDVLVEAGHRCAIPACHQVPVEIAHIVPWAEVREHKFENLIALCPTCHTRYDAKQIDRLAMRRYKANLSVLNSRYGDLERRVLLYFADNPEETDIALSGGMGLLLSFLVRDGYLEQINASQSGPSADLYEDIYRDEYKVFQMIERYRITQAGREFINHWLAAQPLDDAWTD